MAKEQQTTLMRWGVGCVAILFYAAAVQVCARPTIRAFVEDSAEEQPFVSSVTFEVILGLSVTGIAVGMVFFLAALYRLICRIVFRASGISFLTSLLALSASVVPFVVVVFVSLALSPATVEGLVSDGALPIGNAIVSSIVYSVYVRSALPRRRDPWLLFVLLSCANVLLALMQRLG
jgi:hypothetical protein